MLGGEEPSSWLIKIAVEVDLDQRRRAVPWAARGSRISAFEARPLQIELVHEDINDADGAVFIGSSYRVAREKARFCVRSWPSTYRPIVHSRRSDGSYDRPTETKSFHTPSTGCHHSNIRKLPVQVAG